MCWLLFTLTHDEATGSGVGTGVINCSCYQRLENSFTTWRPWWSCTIEKRIHRDITSSTTRKSHGQFLIYLLVFFYYYLFFLFFVAVIFVISSNFECRYFEVCMLAYTCLLFVCHTGLFTAWLCTQTNTWLPQARCMAENRNMRWVYFSFAWIFSLSFATSTSIHV